MSKIIVIDSSAIIALLLNEQYAAEILRVTLGAHLISPSSLPFEIANALSARVKANNHNQMTKVDALKAYSLYQLMPIELISTDLAFHRQALDIATTKRIYSYDAYLLLLAKSYLAPLLTLDGTGKKQGLVHHANALNIALINV
jgi:predicted nucleic acid-binding protein